MQGHCLAVQEQCLQPGACAGAKRVGWHIIKKKNFSAHRDTHRDTKNKNRSSHTHTQPSGPDQYMTRVNLLRMSGSPIKGLGVLTGDHKSQGETNNDVNPQQQHNGLYSLGLWEWRRTVIHALSVFLHTYFPYKTVLFKVTTTVHLFPLVDLPMITQQKGHFISCLDKQEAAA